MGMAQSATAVDTVRLQSDISLLREQAASEVAGARQEAAMHNTLTASGMQGEVALLQEKLRQMEDRMGSLERHVGEQDDKQQAQEEKLHELELQLLRERGEYQESVRMLKASVVDLESQVVASFEKKYRDLNTEYNEKIEKERERVDRAVARVSEVENAVAQASLMEAVLKEVSEKLTTAGSEGNGAQMAQLLTEVARMGSTAAEVQALRDQLNEIAGSQDLGDFRGRGLVASNERIERQQASLKESIAQLERKVVHIDKAPTWETEHDNRGDGPGSPTQKSRLTFLDDAESVAESLKVEFDPMDVCTWRPWFRGKTPYEIEKQLKHIFLRGEAPRTAPVNDAFQALLRWLLAAEADPRYWADQQGTGRRMGLTLFYRVNGSSYKMTETEFLQACEENSYNFDPLLNVLRLSGKKDAYKTKGSSGPAKGSGGGTKLVDGPRELGEGESTTGSATDIGGDCKVGAAHKFRRGGKPAALVTTAGNVGKRSSNVLGRVGGGAPSPVGSEEPGQRSGGGRHVRADHMGAAHITAQRLSVVLPRSRTAAQPRRGAGFPGVEGAQVLYQGAVRHHTEVPAHEGDSGGRRVPGGMPEARGKGGGASGSTDHTSGHAGPGGRGPFVGRRHCDAVGMDDRVAVGGGEGSPRGEPAATTGRVGDFGLGSHSKNGKDQSIPRTSVCEVAGSHGPGAAKVEGSGRGERQADWAHDDTNRTASARARILSTLHQARSSSVSGTAGPRARTSPTLGGGSREARRPSGYTDDDGSLHGPKSHGTHEFSRATGFTRPFVFSEVRQSPWMEPERCVAFGGKKSDDKHYR
ncbi:hypothetical protein ABB37_01804 [Leptomonas pyrrhocoris]|uniref:Uncharacterized protein n=1 Tax=Leptomonas pyrrhocoris TaxID=157538 RepID=A0A0N0DZQ0_LEPPY|nr:hypothetical protein ABB37_01804 [Leptomonas pyrrhocoris]KPA85532.1 hypothetical protein ABB37_01804 [Leptomonas pyrrhocoris]|eukprot:XP_015663971.1 hypothetical protein ABB37_01804 [Leptomonas pyrrhocoris]